MIIYYIGRCCRDWLLAAPYPVRACGECGEVPEYLRRELHTATCRCSECDPE